MDPITYYSVLIKSSNERLGTTALEALVKIGPPAVPILMAALKDREAVVRGRAALALGEIGSPITTIVPALMVALKDKSEVVRHHAAIALGEIGPAANSAVPYLTKVIENLDRASYSHLIQEYSDVAIALAKIEPAAVSMALLTRILRSSDEQLSSAAREMLIQIGQPAIPELVYDLKYVSEVYGNSLPTLQALVEIGPAAIPALINTIEKEDEYARGNRAWRCPSRENAVIVLRMMGPAATKAIPVLVETLKDNYTEIAIQAARALGEMGKSILAIPALIEILNRRNSEFSKLAAGALGEIGPEAVAAVPTLLDAFKTRDKRVHWYVAEALFRIGSPLPAIPYLVEALEISEENWSNRASEILAQIGLPAVSALATALRKAEGATVCVTLVRIGPAVVPALMEALNDENELTRTWAAIALGKLGAPASVTPILIEALKNKSEPVRHHAATTLGEMGVPAAPTITALISALKDSSVEVILQVAEALKKLGSPSPAIRALVETLKSSEERQWNSALHLLIQIGPAAVSILIEMLKDKNEQVRGRAVIALGKIGVASATPELIGALIETLKDNNPEVRWYAAEALINIIRYNAPPELRSALPILSRKWPNESATQREMYAIAAELIKKATENTRALPLPSSGASQSSKDYPVPAETAHPSQNFPIPEDSPEI